jgi:hypothetical protein
MPAGAPALRRWANLAVDRLAPNAERLGMEHHVESPNHGLKRHVKNEGLASLQALDGLVAGTGFEPVTFGL